MQQLSLSEFANQMSEAMSAIGREFIKRQTNELYKGKITLPQFLILDLLQKSGESKMTDLARFLNVTTACMTGIVDRLVRDGYVIRENEPKDRRIIKIKLTDSGSNLARKINEQKLRMLIKIFGCISEKDRQDYLRILMQIKNILTKENPPVK